MVGAQSSLSICRTTFAPFPPPRAGCRSCSAGKRLELDAEAEVFSDCKLTKTHVTETALKRVSFDLTWAEISVFLGERKIKMRNGS